MRQWLLFVLKNWSSLKNWSLCLKTELTTGESSVALVKNSWCSFRGHSFHFQHLHGGSHPLVTPGPGALTPSPIICRHQACKRYIYIHSGKVLMHLNTIDESKNKNKTEKGTTRRQLPFPVTGTTKTDEIHNRLHVETSVEWFSSLEETFRLGTECIRSGI